MMFPAHLNGDFSLTLICFMLENPRSAIKLGLCYTMPRRRGGVALVIALVIFTLGNIVEVNHFIFFIVPILSLKLRSAIDDISFAVGTSAAAGTTTLCESIPGIPSWSFLLEIINMSKFYLKTMDQ